MKKEGCLKKEDSIIPNIFINYKISIVKGGEWYAEEKKDRKEAPISIQL